MSRHLWAGRFDASPAAALDAINRSIDFDRRLWREDIEGSRAHASMLATIGVLSDAERDAILRGLDTVAQEFGNDTFVVLDSDEDIHMAVERRLTELVGDPGRKLHTGRSRNDQVATDMRLFLRSASRAIRDRLDTLVRRIAELASTHAADPLPAYTHLQRGMPTTLGHHLLAWAEMLLRDHDRFGEAARRANVSPLGSGACVGSSFPLRREDTARELGFDHISLNSLDAVSDRDAILDVLYATSMLAMHLSRIGEELVLWSTQEFAFVRLGDAVTTGSSMMPNKKNPDGAELLRGKAGRTFGNLVALLTTMKGLPLTYNKDMQEDKEPLFDSIDTVLLGLDMASAMLDDIRFHTDRMRAACSGWVNATDFCELLVRAGTPLRTAHHQTGRIVALAVERGTEIQHLPLAELQAIAPEATADMLEALELDAIIAARDLPGASAPHRVREAAAMISSRLEKD
ncbi:MAG: argininosuccinate lyase [Deltaproteobacteria bacterium]|nr:MAG: argininosuccinate lyase [Deltaproteobacteria bacterium]